MIRAVVSRCAIWRSKPGDPLPPLRLSPSRPQEVGRTPRRGGPGLKLALSTKARRWACEGVAPASRFGTVRTTPRLRHLWRGRRLFGDCDPSGGGEAGGVASPPPSLGSSAGWPPLSAAREILGNYAGRPNWVERPSGEQFGSLLTIDWTTSKLSRWPPLSGPSQRRRARCRSSRGVRG